MSATQKTSSSDELREFVRTSHVQFHVWPFLSSTPTADATQVGFVLELSADAPSGSDAASPGCQRCQHVYATLRKLALSILPAAERDSSYDFEPFDSSWHGLVHPKVILSIEVRNATDGLAPSGACQRLCIDEMKDNLRALGVRESSLP